MATSTQRKDVKRDTAPSGLQRQYSHVDTGEWLVGHPIWVPSTSDTTCYEEGTVQRFDATTVTCRVRGDVKSFPLSVCRNSNGPVDVLDIQDIARLSHVNDAAVLDVLQRRYASDVIYTYASQLLVAINPFRRLPALYGRNVIQRYKQSGETFAFPTDLPPHTYAVAQKALSLFYGKHQNQSCIVSGESGSGKTETARQLMEFFSAETTGAQRDTNRIQEIVLGSNPLLESFGNAKTLRNNNSSRFGRFLRLGLQHGGNGIQAGEIAQYMLELSRLDTQQRGERNYHIFYQLCRASPPDLKALCKLREMDAYQFLSSSGTYDAETVDDAAEYRDMDRVLRTLIDPATVVDLYKALSGILLCGNVSFDNVAKQGVEQAATLTTRRDLEDVAELFGIAFLELEKETTTKTTEVRGQRVESLLSAQEAQRVLRTMAKECYSAILDIYGFEFFETNSLEQFMINYANEKLQQFFIQNVFRTEEEECKAEGIDHSVIVYEDNAAIIALIDGKRQSILSLLEEQSLLGTAFEKQTAIYLKPKLHAQTSFGIRHTAAPVTYTTVEFVPKNKLKMPAGLIRMLRASTNQALFEAFRNTDPAPVSMKGQLTGSKFATSMEKLMGFLQSSTAHFIRCIKPNEKKAPGLFSAPYVLNQLHSLSILEAVALVLKGFAYRAPYDVFVRDFQVLAFMTAYEEIARSAESRDITEIILTRLQIARDQWQMGHTRVFLRKEGRQTLEKQLKQALQTVQPMLVRLQGLCQSHLLRK